MIMTVFEYPTLNILTSTDFIWFYLSFILYVLVLI